MNGMEIFVSARFAWVWLAVRLYVAYEWLAAGWEKLHSPAWVGSSAGTAIHGFLTSALTKAAGAHPDVSGWYAYFIQHVALVHPVAISYLVTFGELAVGVALVLGLFTSIAAFFGAFMNLNYLFAGTVSVNPILLVLQVLLLVAGHGAGRLGLDRFIFKRYRSAA